MGFWHTGYIEFHEEVGLENYEYRRYSREYTCAACGRTFTTADTLQQHRFESHPLHPPALVLRGAECRSRPVMITSKLTADNVHVIRGERAWVNGGEIPVKMLAKDLSARSSETCRVVLSNADARSEFTLKFHVASQADVLGVEREFNRMASRKRLNIQAVEEFIAVTRQFTSVQDYSDGICSYLHGVLAKERASDFPLSSVDYSDKYERAVEKLDTYDRPLARTIVSVIKFHHNHFSEAAVNGGTSRTAQAARKYRNWLNGRRGEDMGTCTYTSSKSTIDKWITDRDTELIVSWAVKREEELFTETSFMEEYLKSDATEYDRVKVRMLLSELYASMGNTQGATDHAKHLSYLPGFGRWAENRIRTCSRRVK